MDPVEHKAGDGHEIAVEALRGRLWEYYLFLFNVCVVSEERVPVSGN